MSKAAAVDAGPGTFDERAARSLTECMTVLEGIPEAPLEETFLVVSPTGSYVVDAMAETCNCPDALHRGVRCKHARRVDYATGRVPIPGWVDRDAIDDQLGQHVSGAPRIARRDGTTEVLDADA